MVRAWHSLDRVPVNHRVTCRQTRIHTHIHTCGLISVNHPICFWTVEENRIRLCVLLHQELNQC